MTVRSKLGLMSRSVRLPRGRTLPDTLGEKFHLCIQTLRRMNPSVQDHPQQYSASVLARCQCSQHGMLLSFLYLMFASLTTLFSHFISHIRSFLSPSIFSQQQDCSLTRLLTFEAPAVPSRRTSPSFFCAPSPCCSPPAASSPPVSDALQREDTVLVYLCLFHLFSQLC